MERVGRPLATLEIPAWREESPNTEGQRAG